MTIPPIKDWRSYYMISLKKVIKNRKNLDYRTSQLRVTNNETGKEFVLIGIFIDSISVQELNKNGLPESPTIIIPMKDLDQYSVMFSKTKYTVHNLISRASYKEILL